MSCNQPEEPGSTHQPHTDLLAHDLGIVKLVADSRIKVPVHKSQEDALGHTHTKHQIHLGHAGGKGESTVLDHQVDQHLGEGGGAEAGIQEAQVAKEEVHGAVKPGVCPGDENDEAMHGHGKELGRGKRATPKWKGNSAQSPRG